MESLAIKANRLAVTFYEMIAVAAGWAIFGLALLIVVDILMRRLLSISMQGADELGGYIVAITATIGFSYALIRRAHIRIDLLLRRLPLSVRSFVHMLSYSCMTFYALCLTYYGISVFWESYMLGSRSITILRTPLAVPQLLWSVALLMFATVACALLVRCTFLLSTGRFRDVDETFGTLNVEREITRGAVSRRG